MREWPNRTVSKTVVGVRPPWVQIPLPPPLPSAPRRVLVEPALLTPWWVLVVKYSERRRKAVASTTSGRPKPEGARPRLRVPDRARRRRIWVHSAHLVVASFVFCFRARPKRSIAPKSASVSPPFPRWVAEQPRSAVNEPYRSPGSAVMAPSGSVRDGRGALHGPR
jgi:hypothetical protein